MAAPLFPVNAHRYDPYRTFKFQVVIDGVVVAGLSKMSALKKSTDPVDWRTAGDPSHVRKLPGGSKYEAITLETGLTHDKQFMDPLLYSVSVCAVHYISIHSCGHSLCRPEQPGTFRALYELGNSGQEYPGCGRCRIDGRHGSRYQRGI